MMNYESFKKRVLKEFLDYMPDQYSNCEIELRRVPKVNTCLTGVVLKPREHIIAFIQQGVTLLYRTEPG